MPYSGNCARLGLRNHFAGGKDLIAAVNSQFAGLSGSSVFEGGAIMRTAPKSKNSKQSSKKEFRIVPQEALVTNILEATGSKAAIEVTTEERHQLIAEAAYFHAERRSFNPGHELEDWLRAEAEIETRLTQSNNVGLIRNT